MSKAYDVLVMGGGSGGLAMAARAASYGARVGLIEFDALGGTCVNRGCVPKKAMWYASGLAHKLKEAEGYGFKAGDTRIDWQHLVAKREQMISNIHEWYDGYLDGVGVEVIHGQAAFVDNHTLSVNDEQYTAKHIVIATGGRPKSPPEIKGASLGIDSDGVFAHLTHEQPKKVAVVGGGYIALEFAMMFNSLGSEVHLIHQNRAMLRSFDADIKAQLAQQIEDDGIHVHQQGIIEAVEQGASAQLNIQLSDDDPINEVDTLIWAIGRTPNSDNIGLDQTDIHLENNGMIAVDEFEHTGVAGIYALGDIIGKHPLTPVAIAAGRRLADRLYGGKPTRKMDYDNIATVMFTHPPIGTIGLSEEAAREQYGDQAVTVYKNEFVPMYYRLADHPVKTLMKLVTVGDEEKIVGCHIIGLDADEMLQGFAVAIRMGATKQDFDDTIAIHPVSAEELVTMK